jgi:hypothetical protein
MSSYEVRNSHDAETVAKVLRLTQRNTLAWEATADPDTLIAPFKGEYIFRLSRFEDPDSCTPCAYGLSVVKEQRVLMSFDSNALSTTDDLQVASGSPQSKTTAYQYFEELWKRAFFRTNRIPEEFERVNKLLDSELVEASHQPDDRNATR